MTQLGEYPLVFQKDNVNGILSPVGLAETSSLTFGEIAATTVSAASYLNLPAFGGNFTGIQVVSSAGSGDSIIFSVASGNTLNLRGIRFNLGGFVTTTTGTDITVNFNQPLLPDNGGTGNNVTGDDNSIVYWLGGGMTGDVNLTYDGTFLMAPKIDAVNQLYVQGSLIDLKSLATVDPSLAPTHNQLLSYSTAVNKWVSRNESNLLSIPTTPNAVVYNNATGTLAATSTLTYNGSVLVFPNASASNIVYANSFVENGTALANKYQVSNATVCAIGNLLVLPNTLLGFNSLGSPTANTVSPLGLSIISQSLASQVRSVLGLSALATYNSVNLTGTEVTGTLPVSKGGTGVTSLNVCGILYGNGSNVLQVTAPTTTETYLKWDPTGGFSWSLIPTGTFTAPSDPCAVVFVNSAGTALDSDSALVYDKVNEVLGIGSINAGGYVLANGNIASIAGSVAAGTSLAAGTDIFANSNIFAIAGDVYEGGISSGNKLSSKYQAKDATLTTLANANTAADVLLYFSATDAAASTTLTQQGRSIVSAASYSTMRSTLGLSSLSTASSVNLTGIEVIGTLPVTKGGLGVTSLNVCGIPYGDGTNSIKIIDAPSITGTFLRWTNTGFGWSAPDTSQEQWTHVIKTSTETFSTTGPGEDSELTVPTTPGLNYLIRSKIYVSGSSSNGIKVNVNMAGLYTDFTWRVMYSPPRSTAGEPSTQVGASDDFQFAGSVVATGVGFVELELRVVNCLATDITLGFGIATGTGEMKVLSGSALKYTTF